MSWTISRAARETGLSKSTISRAVKSGRISAARQDDGSYRIEPAELFRVYPRGVAQPDAGARHDAPRNLHEEPPATPSRNEEIMQVKIEMLEQMLGRERETVEDLRKRLDAATDRVLALAQPAQPDAEARHESPRNPEKPPKRSGLMGWFRRD